MIDGRLPAWLLPLALGLVCPAPFAHADTSDLAALAWRDVAVPSRHKIVLDAKSPVYDVDDFVAPYAAFQLRGDVPIKVELSSEVAGTLLVPTLQIFDARWQPLATYGSTAFTYEPARFLHPDRLSTEVVITAPKPGEVVYLMVSTTAADAEGATAVQHPAKRYAAARGQPAPAIPDPLVAHSRYGTLRVRFAPTAAPTVDPPRLPKGEAPPVLAETEAHYLTAIPAAIAAGDTAKALQLLDEAERLKIEGARKVFIEASSKP